MKRYVAGIATYAVLSAWIVSTTLDRSDSIGAPAQDPVATAESSDFAFFTDDATGKIVGVPAAASQEGGPATSLKAKIGKVPGEEAAPGACPDDMVEVEGDWCPVVEQYCARWVEPNGPARDRCAEYRPTGRCFGKTAHKHFCVDRFEWPNKVNVKPTVAVNWEEAKSECAGIGKRLCYDQEWTLACEGKERLPYPYGYVRNPEACNIDRPYITPDNDRYADPKTRDEEVARLDQRDPSGAREGCVSPYGVHDMTGNVDEWVVNAHGKLDEKPYRSALKGGYWGPVRDRCRPTTTDHNPGHSGYQIGFRCCSDPASAPIGAAATPSGAPNSGT